MHEQRSRMVAKRMGEAERFEHEHRRASENAMGVTLKKSEAFEA